MKTSRFFHDLACLFAAVFIFSCSEQGDIHQKNPTILSQESLQEYEFPNSHEYFVRAKEMLTASISGDTVIILDFLNNAELNILAGYLKLPEASRPAGYKDLINLAWSLPKNNETVQQWAGILGIGFACIEEFEEANFCFNIVAVVNEMYSIEYDIESPYSFTIDYLGFITQYAENIPLDSIQFFDLSLFH